VRSLAHIMAFSNPEENPRSKCISSNICNVKTHASDDILVGAINVQNARVGVPDPDNLRDFRAERRLSDVSAGNIQ